MIRPFEERDRDILRAITAGVFAEAAIDQYLEKEFGTVNGHDWRWRKLRHIDDDIRVNAGGVFVFEDRDGIQGYVTVMLDRQAGIGRIPNVAVAEGAQGRGVGRKLLDHALDYMKREGMEMAKIETLAGNERGEHLYPSLGFVEIARQIHYFKKL